MTVLAAAAGIIAVVALVLALVEHWRRDRATRELAIVVRALTRLTIGSDPTGGLPLPRRRSRDFALALAGVEELRSRLEQASHRLDAAGDAIAARTRTAADAAVVAHQEQAAALTDALTGLANRRRLDRDLPELCATATRRGGDRFAYLMVDVDHFKQFNDTFGHQAGDELLAGLGRVLADMARQGDVPYRYGGEEFAVVLRGVDEQTAVDAANRIRERLTAELSIPERAITASMGVALWPEAGQDAAALIAAADHALYRAKEEGRDRVVVARPGRAV
jgi:diguanylate cyclase (GGDEF)-like protein